MYRTARLCAGDFKRGPGLFKGTNNTRTANAQAALDGVGQRRLETLKRDSTTESIRLVRIAGNLSQRRTLVMHVGTNRALASDTHPVFQREHPGRGRAKKRERGRGNRKIKLFVRRDKITPISGGTYAWTGTVKMGRGKKKEVGTVTLIHGEEGEISGSIRLETEYYLVRPLNDKTHALVEVNERKSAQRQAKGIRYNGDASTGEARSSSTTRGLSSPQKGQSCSAVTGALGKRMSKATETTSSSEAHEQPATAANCYQSAVDVLVVYTSDAAKGININNRIDAAIQGANAAHSNSNSYSARLNLAHSQQVSINGIGTGSIKDDVGDLESSSTVQSLRDQHDADVVVLLTDDIYNDYNGLAKEIRAEAPDAYTIVEAHAAAGNEFTLAHEVGHLQGAQHDPRNAGTPGDPQDDPEDDFFPDAFGHRFEYEDCELWIFDCDEAHYRTVMAYPNAREPLTEYTRVKHFSNPGVSFRGVSTGTSDRNNADALRTTANTVKNFRSTLQVLMDVTSGDKYDPSVSNYTFKAEPCGGGGSYSYEWRISYQGPGNYGNVLGTGQSFSKSFPPGTHFVKVTVKDNNGQQDSATISITFDPYSSSYSTTAAKTDEESKLSKQRTAHRPENPERLALRHEGPNPFEATTTLAYDLPERTPVELILYDITGREVKRLAGGLHRAGTYRVRLDGTSLPSGIYVVRLNAGGQHTTKRISVVK